MSDLRIALVAEGPTDAVILEAALKAILEEPFILTQLQPEPTRPAMEGGWGGVLKWCSHLAERHSGLTEQDPTLVGFNLLIIHLDADVAGYRYGDCSEAAEQLAAELGWRVLPCARPCPPVTDSCEALKDVLKSWLAPAQPGVGTILCLPAQSSGTWFAAAVLPPEHQLLAQAECDPDVESALPRLPKAQRINKSRREYQLKAPLLTENWNHIKSICSQARDFETQVLTALGR